MILLAFLHQNFKQSKSTDRILTIDHLRQEVHNIIEQSWIRYNPPRLIQLHQFSINLIRNDSFGRPMLLHMFPHKVRNFIIVETRQLTLFHKLVDSCDDEGWGSTLLDEVARIRGEDEALAWVQVYVEELYELLEVRELLVVVDQ